ncbi:class 1 fructose-bisphosphatase [Pseudoxanthobacter sp. M-2]|uniref:class 1 fructose-bisphosphatase n=1 Tax=Pseudoxanthobacter sp. M-2 TaxID=3078754 RepID=UPI0038FCAEBA
MPHTAMARPRLESALAAWSGSDAGRVAVAETVVALAAAGRRIAAVVRRGAIEGGLAAVTRASSTGDDQKALDVAANDLLLEALVTAPVAAFCSEEMDAAVPMKPGAPLVVAVDPLDGSSNIDTNVSVGTIFSVLPAIAEGDAFQQPGNRQLAAGYLLYGPQCALVLTVGDGTDVYTLDPDTDVFVLTARRVRVPEKTAEFAVNASNYRHWDPAFRAYIDECLAGSAGPRGRDFNMRWIASMVAEAHRILTRGGIYLYPGDARRGYETGRLRLIYEANPIGMLIEQAGGGCTTGKERMLDVAPTGLHQRVPLVFGSAQEVAHFERVQSEPAAHKSPLFGNRGLLRA